MLSLSGGFVRQRSRGAAIRNGERFGASSFFAMNDLIIILISFCIKVLFGISASRAAAREGSISAKRIWFSCRKGSSLGKQAIQTASRNSSTLTCPSGFSA